MQVFKEYKANRGNGQEDGFMGGPFFKMAYNEDLFLKGGAKQILKYPNLEADDCIAISVKHVLNQHPNCSVYIITSDKDYLQLMEPRVKIIDLKFNNIAEKKSCFGEPKMDLFCKIIMGDPSDNIPSVLKKCGPKTAIKCWNNVEYFGERLRKEDASEVYGRNRKLVDFDEIPEDLVENFINFVIKCPV
jgi:DNA polymerase-1